MYVLGLLQIDRIHETLEEDNSEKLKRVHTSNNVLKALDVVCAQYLDKSVKTLKADRSNLVNHDAISVPVACHLEPEWPWPDPAG